MIGGQNSCTSQYWSNWPRRVQNSVCVSMVYHASAIKVFGGAPDDCPVMVDGGVLSDGMPRAIFENNEKLSMIAICGFGMVPRTSVKAS